MNKILNLILFMLFILVGCSTSVEKKILDLAGIVFIIFVLIFIIQLTFDKILSSSFYKKIHDVASPIRYFIPLITVLLGIIFFLKGLFSNGLNRINLFLGIIAFLFSWLMKEYNKKDINDKMRAKFAKLMMLCITFGLSLYYLMTIAKDQLKL